MHRSVTFPSAGSFIHAHKWALLLVILLSVINVPKSFSQELWAGKRNKTLVHALISENRAVIDYCTRKGPVNDPYTIIDTLRFLDGDYRSGGYKIKVRAGEMRFFPGNIKLVRTNNADTSSFHERIYGYSNTRYGEVCSGYIWIGKNTLKSLWETQQKLPGSMLPEEAYRLTDLKIAAFRDSIRSYGKSFDSMIVTNNRSSNRQICLRSSDKLVISRTWCQLLETRAELKCVFYLFAAQGTILAFLFTAYDPALAVVAVTSGFVIATGLTAVEVFIANRFTAGKTYVVSFFRNGNAVQKIRIRKDYIINELLYRYKLSTPFAEIIKQGSL